MRYPPRLSHLATPSVVVAKLAPTYAEANSVEDEEAINRLDKAMRSPLHDDLLAACWVQLSEGSTKDEEAILQKVASSLKNRPQRPGKIATLTPGWSAFLVLADVRAGIASDQAQRILETEEGFKRAAAGLIEVGRFLAGEFSRK